MTPQEAAKVLAKAAAYDNRQPNEAAALAWCAAHPETDGVIPLEVAVNRLGIPDAMSRVNICESHGLITKNDDSVSVTPWVQWIGKWRDIQERAATRLAD